MANSNLRLVYSANSAKKSALPSSKSKADCLGSWSVNSLSKKLEELNRLKPAHVAALDLFVNDLLKRARETNGGRYELGDESQRRTEQEK